MKLSASDYEAIIKNRFKLFFCLSLRVCLPWELKRLLGLWSDKPEEVLFQNEIEFTKK